MSTAHDSWKLDHPHHHPDDADEFDKRVSAHVDALMTMPHAVTKAWDEDASGDLSGIDVASIVTLTDRHCTRVDRALRLLELVERKLRTALEDAAQGRAIAELNMHRMDAEERA